jgi:hypothetical protein
MALHCKMQQQDLAFPRIYISAIFSLLPHCVAAENFTRCLKMVGGGGIMIIHCTMQRGNLTPCCIMQLEVSLLSLFLDSQLQLGGALISLQFTVSVA